MGILGKHKPKGIYQADTINLGSNLSSYSYVMCCFRARLLVFLSLSGPNWKRSLTVVFGNSVCWAKRVEVNVREC